MQDRQHTKFGQTHEARDLRLTQEKMSGKRDYRPLRAKQAETGQFAENGTNNKI